MFPSLLLLGCLALAPAGLRGREDVGAVWELVARHLAGDAQVRLEAGRETPDRETAFAAAVVLMDAQPVTDVRMQEVAVRLGELARGDDEVALASAYLLGRLYQVHFFQPDYPRAAQAYEELAARHPGAYWAQLGLVKLALLHLYALPEPAAPPARIAAAEALVARVTIPELQRDLHIVIGRAGLFHGQPLAPVLDHLLAADRIGGLTGLKRGELQLQIAELSRRDGRWEQARSYFQRFLDENDVDGRIYTVKAKLAEIAEHQRAAGEVRP